MEVISKLLNVNVHYVLKRITESKFELSMLDSKIIRSHDTSAINLTQLEQIHCRISLNLNGQLYLLKVDGADMLGIVLDSKLYLVPDTSAIKTFIVDMMSVRILANNAVLIRNIKLTDVINRGFFWLFDNLIEPDNYTGMTINYLLRKSTQLDFDSTVQEYMLSDDVINNECLLFTDDVDIIYINPQIPTCANLTTAIYGIKPINKSEETMDMNNAAQDIDIEIQFPKFEAGIWKAPIWPNMVQMCIDSAEYALPTLPPHSYERVLSATETSLAMAKLDGYGEFGVLFPDEDLQQRLNATLSKDDAVIFQGDGYEALYWKNHPNLFFVRAVEELINNDEFKDILANNRVDPEITLEQAIEDEETQQWQDQNLAPLSAQDEQDRASIHGSIKKAMLEQGIDTTDLDVKITNTPPYNAVQPTMESQEYFSEPMEINSHLLKSIPVMVVALTNVDTFNCSPIPNISGSWLLDLPAPYSNVVWSEVIGKLPSKWLEMYQVGCVVSYANQTYIRIADNVTFMCNMHINLMAPTAPSEPATLESVIGQMKANKMSDVDIMLEVGKYLK